MGFLVKKHISLKMILAIGEINTFALAAVILEVGQLDEAALCRLEP